MPGLMRQSASGKKVYSEVQGSDCSPFFSSSIFVEMHCYLLRVCTVKVFSYVEQQTYSLSLKCKILSLDTRRYINAHIIKILFLIQLAFEGIMMIYILIT